MGTDLTSILIWWVVLFILGLISLPVTTIIFKNFFDHGYAFSKIIGVLILSYLVWVLATLKILPFTILSLFILIILIIGFNYFFLIKGKLEVKNLIQNWKLKLFEEILFFVALYFWSYVKAHEPSIHSLEKFMDFGFINSILRSTYFPPKDLWMTPLYINYYYFGHLVTAILTKLSFIDPAITYNLMVATLFGLTLTGSFSIGSNLYQKFIQTIKPELKLPTSYFLVYSILAGILSSFLVTMGGNLHTIYLFFQNYTPFDQPVPFWQLPIQFINNSYWYPNATRFIPFTIHEFPIYSFVVSDLHGHVLNIPFVLLSIAFALKLFFEQKIRIFHLITLGFLIGIFLMTNVLDGPIYLLLFFLVLFAKHVSQTSKLDALKQTIKSIFIVLISGIIFSLPFWVTFVQFGHGIGIMCMPKFLTNLGDFGPFLFEADHCSPSPIWMLAILWGFFYLLVGGFIFFFVKNKISKLRELNQLDYFIFILAITATILIIIPEIFYAKDIYPAHYRANTVFKFGYQAFIILGLICGYILARFFSIKRLPIPYLILLFIGFGLVAVYPNFAINSYYNNLQNYQGLHGLNYLKDLYPDDYIAIQYLRSNIAGQPIILEAQGDSYTDYARVSSNTGLPTVIGWPVHEWLWRGSYDEAGKRSTDVTTLYESKDISLTEKLIKQYNISYVFVGQLERTKYQNLYEDKFKILGQVIYQSGATNIYKINN